MSFFENVPKAMEDPIFGLYQAFERDIRHNKVNLGIGVYKTADLKSFILRSVKKAEEELLRDEESKDYLAIDGDKKFLQELQALVFGKEFPKDRISAFQTPGGTAALSIAARFLKKYGFSQIFISDPSWPNHQHIFADYGFQIHFYPYFDPKKNAFDLEGFCNFVNGIPEQSAILLQAVCHNPTGIDPTHEQWKEIASLLYRKKLFPIIDCAYQGFGDGLQEDMQSVRFFVSTFRECFITYSCSKNFGLYAERVGALFSFFADKTITEKAHGQMKRIVRSAYSNPPCHGSRIVAKILSEVHLKTEWEYELTTMRERIFRMRKALIDNILSKCIKKTCDFEFMSLQKGMFSYTGLGKTQVERLISDYAIYLSMDGRINIAGLNPNNLSYISEAICNVVNENDRKTV